MYFINLLGTYLEKNWLTTA